MIVVTVALVILVVIDLIIGILEDRVHVHRRHRML